MSGPLRSAKSIVARIRSTQFRDVDLPNLGLTVRICKLSPMDFVEAGDIPLPKEATGGAGPKTKVQMKLTRPDLAAAKRAAEEKGFKYWERRVVLAAWVGIVEKRGTQRVLVPVKLVDSDKQEPGEDELAVQDLGLGATVLMGEALSLAGATIDLGPFRKLVQPGTP